MIWLRELTCTLRTHRSETFTKAYADGELRQRNMEQLGSAMQQHSSLSKDTLKELSVKRATVTPFWWALYIMFKVRCHFLPYLDQHYHLKSSHCRVACQVFSPITLNPFRYGFAAVFGDPHVGNVPASAAACMPGTGGGIQHPVSSCCTDVAEVRMQCTTVHVCCAVPLHDQLCHGGILGPAHWRQAGLLAAHLHVSPQP